MWRKTSAGLLGLFLALAYVACRDFEPKMYRILKTSQATYLTLRTDVNQWKTDGRMNAEDYEKIAKIGDRYANMHNEAVGLLEKYHQAKSQDLEAQIEWAMTEIGQLIVELTTTIRKWKGVHP